MRGKSAPPSSTASCKGPLARFLGAFASILLCTQTTRASLLPRSCSSGVLCLYQRGPEGEERQLSKGCVKAVTASVLAISMVPRQGDNLIRLFSASQREGEWRERGRRGPAFPAACLSLSPPLKLLLIKQSEAKEAGPFHALCWDQRRLSGNAVGLASHVKDPRAGRLPGVWC